MPSDATRRGLTIVAAFVAFLSHPVLAQDMSKYPSGWEGGWGRGSPVGAWDPTKKPGPAQEPPLTEEYRKVYEGNLAKAKAGLEYDPKATCGPTGMPRIMAMYEPMEIVFKPNVVYMLMESVNPVRRIYTDGRDWPKEEEIVPSYVGFSKGKWIDSAGTGKYDTLEIETRDILKGPRLYDGTGIPLAYDNETIIKERMSLDKDNPNVMRNEITTIDHALTRPWTVTRFYKRELSPPQEYVCTEDNKWVVIAGRIYMMDQDGYYMPTIKDQPPPDPKWFAKYFKTGAK